MTHPDDRDPALEELLRTTLSAEADTVIPRGDGLTRIQQRVAARRARRTWLRPMAAVAGVAVVGGAAFGTYALTHRDNGGDDSLLTSHTPPPVVSPPPSTSTKPSPTAPAVAAPAYPSTGFYPFTSGSAEHAWEQGGGTTAQAAYTDPLKVAQSFARDYVGAADVSIVMGHHVGRTVANVTLGRTMSDGGSHRQWPVTVVRLVKYGAAWVVVGADDANSMLKVSTPTAGGSAQTPLTVTGPAYGADEAVQVDVRGTGGSLANAPDHVSFGNGSGHWTSHVAFDPRGATRGAVVVTEDSPADGGVGRITAVGVNFATATDIAYPSHFYGVKNGKVTVYSSRDGASLNYVTAAAPGGGASDPQRVQGLIYYISADGTCASSLKSVPANARSAAGTVVATAASGYVIAGYGVSRDGTQVALWETACTPSSSKPQGLLVSTVLASRTSHTIAFPSFPPMVMDDPVWDPDGQHVVAVVRTGNLAGVDRFDAFTAKDANDVQGACGGASWSDYGLPATVSVDAAGGLWVGAEFNGGVGVFKCTAAGVQRMFVTAGAGGPQDVSVTDDAGAVLVTDGAGTVWRWSGGVATPLHPKVPQPQVSW